MPQVDFYRIQSEFLERALQADLIFSDREFNPFHPSDNFRRPDTPVEMSLIVGICLNGDALIVESVSKCTETCKSLFFDRLQPRLMFFHHPFVMVSSNGRQTLRN